MIDRHQTCRDPAGRFLAGGPDHHLEDGVEAGGGHGIPPLLKLPAARQLSFIGKEHLDPFPAHLLHRSGEMGGELLLHIGYGQPRPADDVPDRLPLDAEGEQGPQKVPMGQADIPPIGKSQRQQGKPRRFRLLKRGKQPQQGTFGILIPAPEKEGNTSAMMQDGPRHRLLAFIQKANEAGTRADLTQADGVLHTSAKERVFRSRIRNRGHCSRVRRADRP